MHVHTNRNITQVIENMDLMMQMVATLVGTGRMPSSREHEVVMRNLNDVFTFMPTFMPTDLGRNVSAQKRKKHFKAARTQVKHMFRVI